MKTIGMILSELRSQWGMSAGDMARALRATRGLLDAVEKGEASRWQLEWIEKQINDVFALPGKRVPGLRAAISQYE